MENLSLLVRPIVAYPTGEGASIKDEPVAAADIDKGLIDLRAPCLHGVPLAGVGVALPQAGALPEPLEGFPALAGVQYFAERIGDICLLAQRHIGHGTVLFIEKPCVMQSVQ